jgi:hypothetical protein
MVFKRGLGLAIIVSSLLIPPQIMGQSRISFSRDKVTEIQSMPDILFEEARIEIMLGKEPETLEAKLFGTIKAIDGMLCFGCVSRVRINPNLKVPIDPFFISFPVKGGPSLQVRQVLDHKGNLSVYFIVPEGIRFGKKENEGFIISGPDGATLKREGNGFLLLDGEAFLLR